jgi:hypothetical protein
MLAILNIGLAALALSIQRASPRLFRLILGMLIAINLLAVTGLLDKLLAL